jgi:hypothetical protein
VTGGHRDLPIVTDAIDSKVPVRATAEPMLGADTIENTAENAAAGEGGERHAPLLEARGGLDKPNGAVRD